jgi:hypothetical protein
MAQLKKTVLGKVSGAVGDIVFRQRDGKNYIGMRPESFIPGSDPASIARRKRFLLALKSGSAINTIPQLKTLWSNVTPSGLSSFNYIVQTNYRYVTSTDISDLLKLVPGNGFGVNVSNNDVDRLRVRVVISAIGVNAGINTLVETSLKMTCVLFMSSPVDESVSAYSLLSLISPAVPISLAQDVSFDAILTSQQALLFDKYRVIKTFIAIVTLDATGNPVHYSGSVLLT